MSRDEEQTAAVAKAIRAQMLSIAGRELSRAETEALVNGVLDAIDSVPPAPSESAAARRQRHEEENARGLALMAKLGNRPGAATIAARRLARDPHDATEVWALAQRFRRLRRQNKNAPCAPLARFPG